MTYPLLQNVDHLLHALVNARLSGHQHNFRLVWFLVLLIDAGEALDLAGARLLVETLHVTRLAHIEWCVDEAFDEGQSCFLVQLARQLTIVVAEKNIKLC